MSKVRNNLLWRQAEVLAKKISPRRAKDMDYIMEIYKRLGGTVK